MIKLSHSELAELVHAARTGDQSAFSALYRATAENQLYFATAFLKDASLAEDAVQETYLSAFRSLDKLDNPDLFVAYLNRICYNTCADYRRRAIRLQSELDQEKLDQQRDERIDRNPDDRYTTLEESHALYKGLSALPDQYRGAFLMRYHHDMKIREIAMAMNCSESTVKRYIKRAIDSMKDNLKHSISESEIPT